MTAGRAGSPTWGDVATWVADEAGFDVVVSSRALRPGTGGRAGPIHRWLRPGGLFVCVDFLHDRFDRCDALWRPDARLLEAVGPTAVRELPATALTPRPNASREWAQDHVVDQDLNGSADIEEPLDRLFLTHTRSWHPYLYWDILEGLDLPEPAAERATATLVADWEASLLGAGLARAHALRRLPRPRLAAASFSMGCRMRGRPIVLGLEYAAATPAATRRRADGIDAQAPADPGPLPPGHPRPRRGGCGQGAGVLRRGVRGDRAHALPGPGGTIAHAEIEIGDSVVMVEDALAVHGDQGPPAGGFEGLTDRTVHLRRGRRRDDGAGREARRDRRRPAQDQFYGDRTATSSTRFGHRWTVATHVEDVEPGGDGPADDEWWEA